MIDANETMKNWNNQRKIDEVNAMWEQWNMRIETIQKLLAKIKVLEAK